MFHWIWHHNWTELEGMVGTECISRTWEAEPGRSWVWSQPRCIGEPYRQNWASLGRLKCCFILKPPGLFRHGESPALLSRLRGLLPPTGPAPFLPGLPDFAASPTTPFLHILSLFFLKVSPRSLNFLHSRLQEFWINVSSIRKDPGEVLNSELPWLAGRVKVELVSLSI